MKKACVADDTGLCCCSRRHGGSELSVHLGGGFSGRHCVVETARGVDDASGRVEDCATCAVAVASRCDRRFKIAALCAEAGDEDEGVVLEITAGSCQLSRVRGSDDEAAVPILVPVTLDSSGDDDPELCPGVHVDVLELSGARIGRLGDEDAALFLMLEEGFHRIPPNIGVQRDRIAAELAEDQLSGGLVRVADVSAFGVADHGNIRRHLVDVPDDAPECADAALKRMAFEEREIRLVRGRMSRSCVDDVTEEANQDLLGEISVVHRRRELGQIGIEPDAEESFLLPLCVEQFKKVSLHYVDPPVLNRPLRLFMILDCR